ncbi:hypothetical protein HELRODRAFT_185938 [Helobdella robusta]|uniref:Sestrin n=1 Tax=Helobdella robusta TaxID=6412 RepID=T1FNG7_HELRO|nr:hypothetical protein HELRODRAFT_185938 [Helobdella robusta]ESN96989.1 hypothetical protein HELRODRAFT_185938 [Helobdella robusta]
MEGTCWCCEECIRSWKSSSGSNSSEMVASASPSTTATDEVFNRLQCFDDYYDGVQIPGPISHLVKILNYHPSYLECFLTAYNNIVCEEGPLTLEYRTYIGIMAVSRHQCTYLVNNLTTEFGAVSENEKWLMGLQNVPQKLRDLDEINKLLAHRPWLVNQQHIKKLNKNNCGQQWSISELTHAVVLLVYYHSLVSLVKSCGIGLGFNSTNACNDVGSHKGSSSASSSSRHNSTSGRKKHGSGSGSNGSSMMRRLSQDGEVERLLERMKLIQMDTADVTPQERLKRFNTVERQIVDLLGANAIRTMQENRCLVYTLDPSFAYEDFATQMTLNPDLYHFPVPDYSWHEHGCPLTCVYYGEAAGHALDRKFNVAKEMTYNTVGRHHDIDTTTFRRAVWHYTQCMFGLMHDNYNYEEINSLLDTNLRTYIKAVTCFPETVDRSMYDGCMKEFMPSEKVHVNIMIHEARLQSELLYGLRAISRYMSSRD